ncbi:MAG: SsrA-binding protein SmpB [Gammaproteobacteria bacterium]|nr:SsrA-binding protein SmpB [Gammaproteobacteria bacterium]
MAKSNKKPKNNGSSICENRRARHDYLLDDKTECGLALLGWEVKSIRAGKAQLVDAYVVIHKGEAWLHGANITPLNTASTHVICEPRRNRKLLMKRKEIDKFEMAASAKGYTLVALEMYWKGPYVKCKIALGKGKQAHDKRESDKQKDWNKQKERIMKSNVR